MTSLEKLLIKGIRSFSPDNQHVVEFFRPLTLIVGHNGAGKTTVIECLKYASTGDLPPNSRNGKSFVHDPKIAGETEVKGQIKLRFRTVSGKSVVCVRSFQLTQRASKLEFKQLESALRTTNEQGEKISLSYRCADLDKQVTELMGVSKAVLENVIFVHQEDSNWPLMEGATLKRKFDDIFAATRYTKALEEIRKARSERQNGIRDLKAEVKLLETYMDAFAQLKDRFSNDGARLEDVQSKIASANEEIQRVEDQLREAHAESEQLSELEDSVLALEAQYKSERQHRDRMEQELEEEFEEDDKELREFLETMDDKLDKVRGDIETLKQKLVNERESAAAANEHHRDLFQKKGEIEAEERVHARDVAELERLAQEAAQSWGIAEQNPVDVLAQMWQKKSLLNDELVRQRESHRQADDQLRVRAEEARSKAARALDQVAALERERDACTGRLEEIDAKRSAAERQFESLDELALQYKEAETRKVEAERQLAALNFAERESARRAELRAARERSALASERQRSLHLHADIRARLAEKKQRYDTKAPALAKGLRDMWSQAVVVLEGIDGESAAHVVAKDPESASAAARTLEEALARAHERTVSLERELTAAAKEYSMVDGQLQACSSARQKRVDERARAEKRLADAGQDADTHAEVLATAEKALENAREEFTSADVMAKTYHFQLQRAKKKHSCPMCERGFSDGEMEDFETLITERVQQLSTSNILDNARAELDRAKAEVEKLYALQEPCQTVHRAAEAIAAADEEIATLQAQRARTLDRRNELGSAHERSREQEEAMSKLVVRFTELRSQESELAGLQKEIAREEQRIRELCVSGASPEEIERELVDANAAVTAAEQAIERARDEHDSARAKVDYANETWRDLRERHLRAENAKLSIQQLQDERGKIVARTDDIAVEQRTAQHEAERMTAAAAAVDEERTVAQRKEDVRANEAEGKLRQLSSSAEALERLRSTVSAYDAAAVAQRAAAVRRDLAAAAELVSTAEASMENIRDIITQNERTLDTQETIRRNIEANIQYREQCKRAETIRERMAEQREQQRKFRPREELNAFIADLDRECNAARANRARLEGMYKEVSEKLEEIKRDMSSAQYEGIEDRLRSAQVQVRTTQLATQDLDLYHQALDKALMKYHALKMNEINKIIKELWQSTYRGSDIDTIAIRADDSGQGVRSYNYRVVMAKGDAELEMRGRCSAGQKVLASLIIRLALAETFCLNCGILALDEPTTNLDKDNMESFAQALGAIIASRRRQSNFQLIVITHDEEFVRLLGNREHADYYWRVFKDTNGHSRLERHSISMMS